MTIHGQTNRYAMFGLLKQATRLKLIKESPDHIEYHKMVRTGKLGFYDYGVGFLNFEIWASACKNNLNAYPVARDGEWFIRTWIATVDDGDMGGWSIAMTKQKAKTTLTKFITECLKNLDEFPSLGELNAGVLRPYGLYVERE